MKEKIQELMSNEAFVQQLMCAETAEDAAKLFSDNGVELTAADIEAVKTRLSNSESELSDEDLESVAGGTLDADDIDDGFQAGLKVATFLFEDITRRRW